jgi:uncharacterized OsmC-like protein
MLKKQVRSASVKVELDLYLGGSVLAGTVTAGARAIRSHLVIESPEPPAEIERLVRLAKQGCFAEQMLKKATPIVSTYTINGQPATIEVPATTTPSSD